MPTEILGIDEASQHVIVRMDRTELYGHLAQCVRPQEVSERAQAMERHPANGPTKREMAGRIDQLLDGGHYVAKGGSRACTMCGTKGDACLTQLRKQERACCPACGDGNTHPAPGESQHCREWAALHGTNGA